MPDISTIWNPGAVQGDWTLLGADLGSGDDLATAVLISLFTDRRADPDDEIPDGSGNPRGWWGDAGRARPLGSKLWLLERSKQTEQVRLRAQDYIREALDWLVEDGIAVAVSAETAWQGRGFLAGKVTIDQPEGRARIFNFQWAWGGVS